MWYVIYLSVVACELALLAMATDLLAGHAGKTGVSAVFFAALGGYGYALLTTRLHLSPELSVAGVLLITLPLSFGVGKLLLSLRDNEYLLGTFALEVGFISFLRNSELTGGPLGLRNVPLPMGWLGVRDPSLAASIILVSSLIGTILILHTALAADNPWGLKLRSIRDDARSAQSLGINVDATLLVAFAVHALIACLVGVGATIAQAYISPDSFGVGLCLWVLAVVYLGGTGSRPVWMLTSAALYVALGELLALLIHDPLWVGPLQQIAFNGALITILLLRRRGLAGPSLEEGPLGGLED
jgi:branched-chain amino acid transport system permease protein